MTEKIQLNSGNIHDAVTQANQSRVQQDQKNREAFDMISVSAASKHSVNTYGGEVPSNEVQSVNVSSVRDGTVALPDGSVTSVEVALNNGWLSRNSDGNLVPGPEYAEISNQSEQTQNQRNTSDNSEGGRSADLDTSDYSDLMKAHDAALEKIETEVPPDQVQSALRDFVDNGTLENTVSEGDAPEGTINAIVDAKVAWADNVAAEYEGASAEFMSALLTPQEAMLAREAVITGNDSVYGTLAVRAAERADDPNYNADILAGLDKGNIRYWKDNKGQIIVKGPDGEESLKSLLMRGALRYAD